jgi:hypothetical protein
MLKYAKAAAPDTVAFRVIHCLGRWGVRESGFTQIIVRIGDIGKISPFRS